jgi:hypothetical protein
MSRKNSELPSTAQVAQEVSQLVKLSDNVLYIKIATPYVFTQQEAH